MPHRDPETGQFTGDTIPSHAYNDYEFQHVHSEYTVSAADLPGAFPIDETDIRAVSLDDLLDRSERADLVAVMVHTLQATVPGTSSAESALQARFELRAGVGSELVSTDDANVEAEVNDGALEARFWNSDSPDVLYFADIVADAGFADSTNGLAGGADQPVIDADIHYPRDYGSCPNFDDRDEITESIYLNDVGSAEIDDSLIQLDLSYTLVFAVHDRE